MDEEEAPTPARPIPPVRRAFTPGGSSGMGGEDEMGDGEEMPVLGDIVGTCNEMCGPFEVTRRMETGETHPLERFPHEHDNPKVGRLGMTL